MQRPRNISRQRNLSRKLFLLPLLSLVRHTCAQVTPTMTSTAMSLAATSITDSAQSTTSDRSSSIPTTLSTSFRPTSYNPNSSGYAFPTNGIFPSATADPGSNRPNDNSNSGSEAYYFVFIGIFFAIIAGALWTVTQRKRKRNRQSMTYRRGALERDMQNSQFDQLFPNSRRWTGEGRRGHNRSRSGLQTSRDEGLNEAGEAPPAYSKNGVGGSPQTDGAGIAIPMQTFQPGDRSKPPDYDVSATAAGVDERTSLTRHDARP